jgi:N-methylhydantoinase A
MSLRMGVDVGGTFTKAVAIDRDGRLVARAVVPTSHSAPDGIASGTVAALAEAQRQLDAAGLGKVSVVGHSTSLAVNALLEGDVAQVGLICFGGGRDAAVARRRTDIGQLPLAPGRSIALRYEFINLDDGSPAARIEQALDAFEAAGVTSIATSAAFGPDDPAPEIAVLEAAARRGLPACAGHQLSGMLGLELRTVSAVLNAAILPRARAAARVVAAGMAAAGIEAPLLVLRGDGGATDLASFGATPIFSLFSGPAASVAGALHHLELADGIVLEVGGTSTNVCVIRDGRPSVSYVRVGDRTTALRSIDVWVAGVAGGSLARIGRREVAGVGPRSAHIGGLRYACFADPAELAGARGRLAGPLADDTPDHLVVDADGGTFALTVTCAANATGLVVPGTHAVGSQAAAQLAFEAAGRVIGRDGQWLAHRMLERAVDSLAGTIRAAAASAGLDVRRSQLVGVGGGAGALASLAAEQLRMPVVHADNAEVLSSIGAARAMIHAAHEVTIATGSPDELRRAVDAAEAAAVAAGAAPASIETRTEFDSRRRTLRATASGSLPLETGAFATDGRAEPPPATDQRLHDIAASRLAPAAGGVREIARTAHYRAYAAGDGKRAADWALLDGRGALAYRGRARRLLHGRGDAFAATLASELRDAAQGGISGVTPPVVVVAGRRILDCAPLTSTDALLSLVGDQLRHSDEQLIVAIEEA